MYMYRYAYDGIYLFIIFTFEYLPRYLFIENFERRTYKYTKRKAYKIFWLEYITLVLKKKKYIAVNRYVMYLLHFYVKTS